MIDFMEGGEEQDSNPMIEYAEDLAAYLEGEGTPEERRDFENLMDIYPELREEYEQAKQMYADFGEESLSDPDEPHASDDETVYVEPTEEAREFIKKLMRKPR